MVNITKPAVLEKKGKAHIPPETAFTLGNNTNKKGDKQHEIDILNANLMRKLLNATIFHRSALGFALGWVHEAIWISICWYKLHETLVLGGNTSNAKQPNTRGFAFWYKIGLISLRVAHTPWPVVYDHGQHWLYLQNTCDLPIAVTWRHMYKPHEYTKKSIPTSVAVKSKLSVHDLYSYHRGVKGYFLCITIISGIKTTVTGIGISIPIETDR